MLINRLREYGTFLKSLTETNVRLIGGMWRLTKLPQPAITVFGSSRMAEDDPIVKQACELSKKLALGGFSIITGGGPGIMQAANRGAYDAAKELRLDYQSTRKFNGRTSFGIGLTRLNRERFNPYVDDYIVMKHFFARKWLLVRYSVGFVVFPGGFGTMDEVAEVLTLIQCERMEKYPIILFDKAYWMPLYEFVYKKMLAQKLINENDLRIITAVTSDVDEAYEHIVQGCKALGFNGSNSTTL